MATSPLTNRIGQVFIPVRDMAAAAPWYARLLGLPENVASHEGTILDLPTLGDVGLALDSNRDFTADGPPRFFWWVDDLEAVRTHLDDLGVEVVGAIEDVGSVSFLQFRDLDGNLLMACAPN